MASTTRRRTKLLRGVLVVLVVVGVLMGLLAVFQRQLIYYPDTSAVPPASSVIDGARDVTLETSDGLELGAYFVPATSRDMAVLVAPGNGGNRAGRADLARALNERGFAVLLMDYRGYGGNPGTPSEEGLGRDALAAVSALSDLGYPPSRTIYFGESLGTGVVAALQSRRTPAGRGAPLPVPVVGRRRVAPLPVPAGAAAAQGRLPGLAPPGRAARCR